MKQNCIFCKIIGGEISAKILYSDDKVVVFEDINPQAPTHLLIVSKKHIPTLLDITPQDSEIISQIFLVIKKVAQNLGIDERGFRVVVNCKQDAGQEVYHIHFHLLAGRKFKWPPG